jgi:hypothetical protein
MTIRRELIDELLKDYERSQDILGEGGLLKEFIKSVVERCLETELDSYLGYQKPRSALARSVHSKTLLANARNARLWLDQRPFPGRPQGIAPIGVNLST